MPPGCSSLYGEFSYLQASPQAIQEKITLARKTAQKLFDIADYEIMTQKIITIPHAYVIFDNWRDKNVPQLLHALENDTIFSIGRYGGWKYASMQEGFLDGKHIADRLII